MYAIDDRGTFNEIQSYYGEILRVKQDLLPMQIPMVLVGLKSDMKDERDVHPKEGMSLAAKLGIPFLEASAKKGKDERDLGASNEVLITFEGVNVEACFHEAIRQCTAKRIINASLLNLTAREKKKKQLQVDQNASWTNKTGSFFEGKTTTTAGEGQQLSGSGTYTFSAEDNPLISSSEGGWWQGKRHLLGIVTFRVTGNSYFAQWANGILVSPLRQVEDVRLWRVEAKRKLQG